MSRSIMEPVAGKEEEHLKTKPIWAEAILHGSSPF